MKNKIFLGVQVLSGIMLVVFGLNGFLQFIPMPQPPVEMGQYMGALFTTGFIFPIVAVIEILAGVSFIVNKYTSFMAIIVMPIMINAFLAHLFLDLAGIGGSAFLIIATLIVMIKNKERYQAIFKA